MKMWKTRKYYQLQDFFDAKESTPFWHTFLESLLHTGGSAWNYNQSSERLSSYPYVFKWNEQASRFYLTSQIMDVLNQIGIRHQSDILFALDEDEDTQDNADNCLFQWLLSFIFIANNTAPRYATMLDLYEDEKENLMKALKNTSNNHAVSRFNDTPQDTGDFEGETYATNVTIGDVESTNEINPMTTMERLREIDESYRNIMLQWANEFDSLFLDGANI